MRAFLSLFALGVAASAGPADAQTHWVTLGSATVSVGRDHGIINVISSRSFRQVRVCVSRNSIRLSTFRVRFHRGGQQRFTINRLLHPGQCTLAYTLHPGPLRIHNVQLGFAQIQRNAQPTIRLQGR